MNPRSAIPKNGVILKASDKDARRISTDLTAQNSAFVEIGFAPD